jgi:DNA topoisomerase-3
VKVVELHSLLRLSRHILHAARNPIDLDDRQVDAVSARIELDLRIGYAFTRFQTKLIQPLGGALADAMISYGMG